VGELILNQFRDLGVKVIAADSGTELTAGDDDPTRTLIRQVLGAVAQFCGLPGRWSARFA
jgi:DNA invertase Pin-like site-specific DNA recombinase